MGTGKIKREIVQFWTEGNQISENRLNAVWSLSHNSGVPCRFLLAEDIARERLHDVPFHKAYPYLSAIHKSDYVRCYWMHHFGGGYADIKHYSADNNWADAFDFMDDHPDIDIVGTPELSGGCPIPEWNSGEPLSRLVILCYIIVRPHSEFSTRWWNGINERLDARYEELKAHPAKEPRDRGRNGSGYPLRWAEINGEIFHRACHDLYPQGKVSMMLKSGREWRNYK